MVTLVKFSGGLGNQLFQYAAARALTLKHNVLLFDCSNYSNDYLGRKFELNQFRIKGKEISNRYLLKLFTPQTRLNRFADKLQLFSNIQEEGFFIHKGLQDKIKFLTSLSGYWQSEVYFETIRNELLQELALKYIPELPQWITQTNTVAVHVRRTDYLKDVRYGFLGEVYYQTAINYLRQKLGNPLFVFFSDDVEWCKQTFTGDDILFCNEPGWQADYLQLYLMSKCNHQVIANSSFSWWSAWLNENKEKLVIRPKVPFRDATLCYEHYYPESWIVL